MRESDASGRPQDTLAHQQPYVSPRVRKLVCTILLLGANSVAAASDSTNGLNDVESNQKITNEQPDFRSVSDEARKRAEDLRAKIEHAERLQPGWNSAPMKAQLDRAIISLDSSLNGASAFYSLLKLSCQTPLLDLELVKSADALFESLSPWCRAHNILWFRSGGDTSAFLPWIPKHSRLLEQQLDKIEADHACPEIHQMQSLFAQCTRAFDKGDTRKADTYAWNLLKLAEQADQYEITEKILEWYHLFLSAMTYRPNPESYRAQLVYVQRETRCVPNDHCFIATLNRLQSTCEPTVVNNLRIIHKELVRRRRLGDTKEIKKLYAKLVDLANKSDDRTCAIPYFALNAYHSYLETDLTTANYSKLRKQLYSAWIAEELGKQPLVREKNLEAGGDWRKIETALESLERQSFFVCRAVQRCRMWGESNPRLLWNERHGQPHLGMIYYEGFSIDKDLYLVCCASSEYKNGCLVDGDPQPVVDALMKSLIEAGFKPNSTGQPGVVHVTGAWTMPEKSRR